MENQTSSARTAASQAQIKVIEEEKEIKEQELKKQEKLQLRELYYEQHQIEDKRQLATIVPAYVGGTTSK